MKKRDNQSLDALNQYFRWVKNIPQLSPAEEHELIIKAKEGDPEALKRLIASNQKLVVKEALKYYFQNDNLLDLINEGNKGLFEALKRFDSERENRFFTYAQWWVRSEIRRYLSKNQKLISFPDIFYNDYLHFKKCYERLQREYKRPPNERELSRHLKLPPKTIKIMLEVPDEIFSLDKTISENSNTNFSSFISGEEEKTPEDLLIESSMKSIINKDLDKLTPREAEIIKLRFGFEDEPMRLRAIATKLKMSAEGIRRIEKRALEKLKNNLIKRGVYGALN